MPTERGAWRIAGLVAGAALLALGAWYLARGDPAPLAEAAPVPAAARGPGPAAAQAEAPGVRAERRRRLLEQARLTDHTYCSYLAHSRYPHDSRPAGHNPDQLYPNHPVLESNPMRMEGGEGDAAVILRTSQSRVHLAAGETAAFSLSAVDARGQALPMVVTRALAQGITYGTERPAPRVALAFHDGGGAWRAQLAPAQTSLAAFHGTIRTEVRYSAGGRKGFVLFDVLYSPGVPATWTGLVRERRQDGSLQFVLGLDVRQPGRYVVSGRIDDARGQPFALATFNEVLGQGAREVRLPVFGKLLHDGAPALPLALRDVEGYLLRENTDPDRLLLPRREGKVASGTARTLDGISNAEWQSEERSRHLAEYAKDRRAARAALARTDPGAPLPASACTPARE